MLHLYLTCLIERFLFCQTMYSINHQMNNLETTQLHLLQDNYHRQLNCNMRSFNNLCQKSPHTFVSSVHSRPLDVITNQALPARFVSVFLMVKMLL